MFRDKINKIFKRKQDNEDQEGNDKSKIENLIFFIILLIVTVIVINVIWNGDKKISNDSSKKLAMSEQQNNSTNSSNIETDTNLEEKLKNILSKIQGVGNVEVCINYSESSETIAMYNETSKTSSTEETDTSGENKKVEEKDTQKDIIYQEEDGKKKPITQKIIHPKIEGAIITAQGVTNAEVKNNVIQAVEAVTGLPTHKIQVFEMK